MNFKASNIENPPFLGLINHNFAIYKVSFPN